MTETKDIPTRGLDKAYDSMKHIATLSTGVISLTVTFADKFKVQGADLTVPWSLSVAWALFTAALVFSIWATLAVTGSINSVDTSGTSNSAMTFNIRAPSVVALLCFALAVGFTAHAGYSISR